MWVAGEQGVDVMVEARVGSRAEAEVVGPGVGSRAEAVPGAAVTEEDAPAAEREVVAMAEEAMAVGTPAVTPAAQTAAWSAVEWKVADLGTRVAQRRARR